MLTKFFSFEPRGSKPNPPAVDNRDYRGPSPLTQDIHIPAVQPLKRRRDSDDGDRHQLTPCPKRPRVDDLTHEQTQEALTNLDPCSEASEQIEMAFASQIQLKHMELESINKELGKCQAALEQLRRCHLVPYPVNVPTPEQMLDVAAGRGHALQRPGQPVPRHAPPFGVTDGPYARHYAKWLIPHPDFDGVVYDSQILPESMSHTISTVEGRSTRNSGQDSFKLPRGRSGRGDSGSKFHVLPAERPPPKARAGPCLISRSDGVTVKLECVDCARDNFNSVQGFINHCRIAHKREFKSHDEAATKSGKPWDSKKEAEGAGQEPVLPKTSRKAPKVNVEASASSGNAHPLAATEMSHAEACTALASRIEGALALYQQGQISASFDQHAHRRGSQDVAVPSFEASSETPHLSQLMRSRKFSGSLKDIVQEISSPIPEDELSQIDVDSDDETDNNVEAQTPSVVKRMPVGATTSPMVADGRSTSSKGVTPGRSRKPAHPEPAMKGQALSSENVEMDEPSLSPNTIISNNAPSLVSDDGEYDESEDASSVAGHSEALDAESVSDVADINIDEEHEPRNLRRSSVGANTLRLRREDPKQVSFVTSLTNERNTRGKRKS